MRRIVFISLAIAISLLVPFAQAQSNNNVWHNQFLPHGYCLQWNPALIWTMVLANLGIALAYFAIPIALWYFVRHRKDIPYPWIFRLFGMFIIACGITHLMNIITFYQPLYWLEAIADAYTAVISLVTAVVLWPLIPKALLLKSPKELEEANDKLQQAIRESKEITAELQAQAELLNLAHDAIMMCNLDGIIHYWNPGAEETYGYKAKEAIGKDCYALLNTQFITPRNEIECDLINKGRWDGELINYRADGQKIIVASRQALKQDAEGYPFAVLTISIDITEQKKAEERRLTMAEMERSNAELEQFAAIASHDLQEPLRAVAGCLTILQKTHSDKLDPNAEELIHYAVDGAVRMRTLINDLLSLSRVGSDGGEFTPTDLNQTLESALHNLAVPIEERYAQVTHENLPTVWADKTQMTQLFQNLVNNAIKFCNDKTPEIHIGASYNNDKWTISVKDNGIGFEQHYADKIFQPFKRLHGRDKYPGTGIGLAICKRIIERHSGVIWVESEIGKGTTFYFSIKDTGEQNDGSTQ